MSTLSLRSSSESMGSRSSSDSVRTFQAPTLRPLRRLYPEAGPRGRETLAPPRLPPTGPGSPPPIRAQGSLGLCPTLIICVVPTRRARPVETSRPARPTGLELRGVGLPSKPGWGPLSRPCLPFFLLGLGATLFFRGQGRKPCPNQQVSPPGCWDPWREVSYSGFSFP